MSASTRTPPEDPEDELEDEDMEEEDEEEEESDDTFEVEEILDMKFANKQLRFETIWVSDHSKTWEPVENFSGGIEHQEIVKFRERHAQKFKTEYAKYQRFTSQERSKKKSRKTTWTYVSDEDIRHETPVETATTRETKALFDPNRIEDPDEAFLKTFDTGGRLSRSQMRELKKNLNDSTQSSPQVSGSNSRINSPLPPAKKRGRKPGSKNKVPPKNAPEAEAPEKKKADAADTYVKKRRDVKLNSSDSSEDEDDQPIKRRKKKKVMSPSISRSPTKSPSPEPGPKPEPKPQPKPPRAPPQQQPSTSQPPRKRAFEAVREEPRNPRVVYHDAPEDSDSELDEQLSKLGLSVFKGDVTSHFAAKDNRKKIADECENLNYAILRRKAEAVEWFMKDENPAVSLQYLKDNANPLHKIMMLTHDRIKQNDVEPSVIAERKVGTEEVIRAAMSYLPIEALMVVDAEKNTMLHCAIFSKHFSLVKYFTDLGAPLHTRNIYDWTPLDTATYFGIWPMMEYLIKNGSTFHYMARDYVAYMDGEDSVPIRKHLLRHPDYQERRGVFQNVNKLYDMLEEIFSATRLPFLKTLNELAHGPIVCMPRGKLLGLGAQQILEFKFPGAHSECDERTKYLLVVMCMAYSERDRRFVAIPSSPKMVREPTINEEPCSWIKPRAEKSMFFNATAAVKKNKELALERMRPASAGQSNAAREYPLPIHPDVFRIRFNLEMNEPLSFIAFQLIRYEFKLTQSRKLPYHMNRH